ncbi:VOC family protein [Luteimonas sp. RD2P54]|uniref:VOC family protein n=1 Tax=Luteimonas endophytica TaxID=3042023 RepID=A0ABT6J5B2_9GAMM|nr:VOC family protein [Luteimonas endophytica]MDH5821994.1 VOC family protein [Luteimonas endophytica]
MPAHEKINYVEYPARDLAATKRFFQDAFGWAFEDYGPDYAAFSGQGLDGGFFRSELAARTSQGSALVVFYSERLEETLAKVVAAGGEVVKPVFSFPGGRRFHFTEPSGNEFAVWSEAAAAAGDGAPEG